ncbi:MAG: galactitol-1-phosphate 5-dehydrogenase [Lachnospiraceae bacterium]|nr:galactitol-1-phosphate 5-dehydrogenase [Lachnospiraceae bacterium]
MKAWVLHDKNDIRYEEVAKPIPNRGEVLVRVSACGICGSDIPRIYHTGAHKHPLIPGHEFAGVVESVGTDVEDVWIGKRVGVFPLIPCQQCLSCASQQYEMCKNYNYLGSRCDGGFAEYVVVPEWNLIEIPRDISMEVAAMLEPMAVAVHAMRRITISSRDTIVVCGLGTIGLLLVMFLMDAGYKKIYVIGNKEFQYQQILKLGLPDKNYYDIQSEELRRYLLQKGVNVYFECVGKNETLQLGVSMLAPNGTCVTVGNPYSDMMLSRDDYWKILRSQLSIIGTWNSSFKKEMADDWHYVLDRLQKTHIPCDNIISHRFLSEELDAGLQIMKDKTENYIKVMMINPHK